MPAPSSDGSSGTLPGQTKLPSLAWWNLDVACRGADALPPKTVFARVALVLPVFAGSHVLALRFIQCAALIPTDGSVGTELGRLARAEQRRLEGRTHR
jgi:hypothetical protein